MDDEEMLKQVEADIAPKVDTDAVVDAWFAAKIHNSPASRDTAVYNYLRSAVIDLKARLKGA